MTTTIAIPQQEIRLRHTNQGKPVTVFAAQHDGALLANCEAWGDHMATLNAAMHSQQPVTVDKLEYSERWNRWSVWLPRAGGGANGRGNRPWGEARPSYRGQPVPLDTWVRVSGEVLAHAVAALEHAARRLAVDLTPVSSADVILREARSLVAQYWMAVERNLTFPPGFEPRSDGATAPPSPAVATPPTPHANPPATRAAQAAPLAQTVYAEALELANSEADVRDLMAQIRAVITNKVDQAKLLTQALQRLRVVAPREPGDL